MESYFYDEIPESLVFKGDPAAVSNYNIFVFKRITGYEIIYFDEKSFYSIFEKEVSRLPEGVVLLARKFSLPLKEEGRTRVLSEVRLDMGDYETEGYRLDVDLIGDSENGCFFLPDVVPVRKQFSNISQNKQVKSVRDMMRLWDRNLNIIILCLLLLLVVNGVFYFYLKKDNSGFRDKFTTVSDIMDGSELLEFRLNKLKTRLAGYPDHMLYLQTIAKAAAVDENTMLIDYTLGDGQVTIEGYSGDSLAFLSRLRDSKQFKEVKFKTTVTKNAYSSREKFEIEIRLKDDEQ